MGRQRAPRGRAAIRRGRGQRRLNTLNLGRELDVHYFMETNIPDLYQYNLLGNLRDNCCIHCNAYRWPGERRSMCCCNGSIHLAVVPPPPEQIMQLYTLRGRHFLDHITAYNNLFALASLGATGFQVREEGFRPTVAITGKVYHRIGSLLPTENEAPKFAQLYFHDTEHEVDNRVNVMDGLDRDVIEVIQDCLHTCNPYITSLKSGIELMENNEEIQLVLHANSRNRPRDAHVRQYNLPTASEVGAIIPGENIGNLDVILHCRDGPLQRINTVHRSYDPLNYVLMFPTGVQGYELGMRRTDNKTLTALDFYSYRLQERRNEWNIVMKCRRLTQQYAVDMWSKIVGARLDWVRRNQTQIRAEKYNGLLDAQAAGDLANAGHRIILPPTVYGSPRFYTECLQNAMVIVRKYGKPDLFITFTCNPKWNEIQSGLNQGEKYTDRPDLCVRVFKLKTDELMNDLIKKEILGKVRA